MELWDGYQRDGTLARVDLVRGEIVPEGLYHLVCEIIVEHQDGSILADAVVAAQNPGLNPAYLAQAIERELPSLKPDFVRVRRTEIYDTEGNVFR